MFPILFLRKNSRTKYILRSRAICVFFIFFLRAYFVLKILEVWAAFMWLKVNTHKSRDESEGVLFCKSKYFAFGWDVVVKNGSHSIYVIIITTTGNRSYAECQRVCQVQKYGHSANCLFAEWEKKCTRQKKTLGKRAVCRVSTWEHSANHAFAECLLGGTRQTVSPRHARQRCCAGRDVCRVLRCSFALYE